MTTARKRIWGWFFFDWASQPYNTLLLTFIFGPYVKEVLGDGTTAQSAWGFGIAAAGVVIAVSAPVLGALADTSGTRMRWIWIFSAMYVVGSAGLWITDGGIIDPTGCILRSLWISPYDPWLPAFRCDGVVTKP